MIKVVHCLHSSFTHYIGRAFAGFAESPFHNPFHVGKDGDRAEVMLKFAVYWYSPERRRLRLAAQILIPDDSVLGCWCHPKYPDCHGDLIAGYLEWKRQNPAVPIRGLFDAE